MYPELIKNLIKAFSDLPGVSERAATRYIFHFLKKPQKDIETLAKELLRLKKDITLCSHCYNIAQKTKNDVLPDDTRLRQGFGGQARLRQGFGGQTCPPDRQGASGFPSFSSLTGEGRSSPSMVADASEPLWRRRETRGIRLKPKNKLSDLCVICQDKKRREEQICLVEKISDIERIEGADFYNGVYHVLGGLLDPIKGITPNKLTFKRLVARLRNFQEKNQGPELIIALNPTREGDLTVSYLREILAPLKIKITRLARGIPTGGELQYADEDTLKESFLQRKRL